jgi:hypothetical protein
MPPKSPVRPGLPTVAEAVAAMQKVRARGPGRRSPLYLWLREHHDALTSAFAKSAPAWAALAAYLGEHGLTDGDAKHPTARGTRDAWWRVRRDVATARARRQGTPAPELDVGETAPGVSPIPVPAEVASPNPAEAGEPPHRTFRTATLRGHVPASPPPFPAPTTDKSASDEMQDPDDVIARFVGRSTESNAKSND